MKKFKFVKHVYLILMTAAILAGGAAFGAWSSLALDAGRQKLSIASFNTPDARKAEFEKQFLKNKNAILKRAAHVPANSAQRPTPPSGDDGRTNWDFIIPVTHKTTAPDGYAEIKTQDDLNNIRDNLSGKFIMMNDITMEDTWIPIGVTEDPFTGTFDGNGYVIKNMRSEASDGRVGLFGKISGAAVMNLGMENGGTAYGSSENAEIAKHGGIVAESVNSLIDNCRNKGDTGRYYDDDYAYDYTIDAGGIAASVLGEASIIKNCYNSGDVFNSAWAGGITGYIYSGSVENCYNTGYVHAIGYAGGIAAKFTGEIKKCYNSGEIFGGDAAGGIVGYNSGIDDVIENCCNTGSLGNNDEHSFSGGIIGVIGGGHLSNSYTSNTDAGGGIFSAAAYDYSDKDGYSSHVYISNCYYPKNLEIDMKNAEGFQYLNLDNIKALSETEMKQKKSFAGFDFEDVWNIDEGNGTPFIRSMANDYIYLSGKVTDASTGSPIADANIILRIWNENSENPAFEERISSDKNGEYSAWILPGTISIRATKRGYYSFSNGSGEKFTGDKSGYNISLEREQSDEEPPLYLSGTTFYYVETDKDGTEKKISVRGVTIEVESYDKQGISFIETTSSSIPANASSASRFRAGFHPGEVRIVAQKEGYKSVYIQDYLNENQDNYEILIEPLFERIYIELDVKSVQPHIKGVEPVKSEVSNFGNLRFELIDKTDSSAELIFDEDFTVSGNNLIIMKASEIVKDENGDTWNAGDIEGHTLEIIITDISGKMGVASASFKFTREEAVPELSLVFTEQGKWQTAGTPDESLESTMVLLFGEDGGFIERFVPVNRYFDGRQLQEGNYKLVFIENYPTLQQVPNINYFSENGFSEDTDYILKSVRIEDGIISVVDIISVPLFYSSGSSIEYLNLDETSLTLNRYRTPKDYSVLAVLRFSVDKEHIMPGTDVKIRVTLTENCVIYGNNSPIWLDGKRLDQKQISISGKNIDITIPEKSVSGNLQFYIIATEYGENTLSASLSFDNDDSVRIRRPIGTVSFFAYQLEITNLPARVIRNQYTITGNSHAGSWISVYVDGVEVKPAVKANSAGSWRKTIVLSGDIGETVYNIRAEVSLLNANPTDELELVCEISETPVPAVSGLNFGIRNNNNDFYGGVSVKHEGGEWVDEKYLPRGLKITQPFGYMRYVKENPWFIGDEREMISFKVSFTEDLAENSKAVVAAYDGSGMIIAYVALNYNRETQMWEGRRNFHDNQLPQTLAVLYTVTVGNSSEEFESENISLSSRLDPSGFVYEAVASNRLSDAEVTLRQINDDETTEEWNAEEYNQINPVYTRDDGSYMWDIPSGKYQVSVLKDGYETSQSEPREVPPPYTGVNIGLISHEAPRILSAEVSEDYGFIEIKFSKYMDISMISKENVILTGYSKGYSIEFMDAEESPDDNSEIYASIMRLYPNDGGKFEFEGSVRLKINAGVKSYAGIVMASEYLQRLSDAAIDWDDENVEIDRKTGFVTGITPGEKAKVGNIRNSLVVNGEKNDAAALKFFNVKGELLGEDDNIGTGSYITPEYDENDKLVIIIIYGDVTGSGRIDTDSLQALLKYIMSGNTGGMDSEIFRKAAEITKDGKIDIEDVMAIRRYISGKKGPLGLK